MSDEISMNDLGVVYAWILVYGGSITERLIVLNKRENRRFIEPFRGDAYLREAADWVRAQLPKGTGG